MQDGQIISDQKIVDAKAAIWSPVAQAETEAV